uniref:Uncharacterized protein n=1 Tax=Anopheles farauti TaxID=69004 RepID=A0A182QAT0_9DIPT
MEPIMHTMETPGGAATQLHPDGTPPSSGVRIESIAHHRPSGEPAGMLAHTESIPAEQLDETTLNARLLAQLNEQFENQLQLVESEGMDDGFKLKVYSEWVNSLRTLNMELVQSLREVQDTCMERMHLMRAAYLKDLVRFGPDVRLKWPESAPGPIPVGANDQLVTLEFSSNYPIPPDADEMLLRELSTKTREFNELRKQMEEQRCVLAENGSMLEQLRNITLEREKQLDDKRREITILQQQIRALNEQLLKAKMSTAASTDHQSLISEITDHHDKITQLKKKLKEQEDKLRQANTAIQFRDEVITQQRQEIKLLNEKSQFGQPSANSTPLTSPDPTSFHSIVPGDDPDLVEQSGTRFSTGHLSRSLIDELDTVQQGSESETQCVLLLKRELGELREQLHQQKKRPTKDGSARVETEKALLRLRGACEELLQSTGKLCGSGNEWRERESDGRTVRFDDDDDLIEAMRDRCEVLCRQLSAEQAVEQDEGIGSASASRLEHSEPTGHASGQQQMVACIEYQLKQLLGAKERSSNSATESLSSLSFGLDEGCTLQRLIDDLKKEIESKDLVLRDRHAEMERLQHELASRDRALNQVRTHQETVDRERTNLLQKITELEECVDDQNRTIAMLNMEKLKLVRQVDDLKETLQQYRDNLQKTSEEKIAIEDECKNLLVTVSNLRVALEETKRNGSSSVSFFSGLRYGPPQPQPQTYRVSYLHTNGRDDSSVENPRLSPTPSPPLTTASPSAVTSNSGSSNSSNSTGSSNSPAPNATEPAQPATGDYWSAIGRALFSGFES